MLGTVAAGVKRRLLKTVQLVRAMGERNPENEPAPSLWLGNAFDALLRGELPTIAILIDFFDGRHRLST